MDRAQEKAQRLLQIEQLLWAHPEGLTRAEIARRLGVNRSTITKYLNADDLPKGIYEEEGDGKQLKMDRNADLTKASFTLHEIMAIHLATRLLATRTDKQNPHAASALRKLGKALQRLDQNVSRHLLRSADVMDENAAYRDPVYLKVLETLTEAWSAGRKVKVSHQMEDGRIFEYDFAPYFIEPYAVGQTAHAIGWREPPGAIRTLKIERIRSAQISHDRYEIPADFDPGKLLRDAWGIWYSDAEPIEVVLRFHPRVALRVKETHWHSSQQIEEQADGYLLWRARVAEPQEMLPWIRGWGADVEVVGPVELRETLMTEARKLTTLYGVTGVPEIPLFRRLWGKTSEDKTLTHPLICHMLDVAQVTTLLWTDVLTDSIRRQMADALDLEPEAAGRVIPFWVGLHDLGKASPAFQRKHAPAKQLLENAGLKFPLQVGQQSCHHGAITAVTLPEILKRETGSSDDWADKIAVALGGHHGDWPTAQDIESFAAPAERGSEEWNQVRRDLVLCLKAILQPPRMELSVTSVETENTFLTLLSGLTSVADWIGSMEDYFQPASEYLDPALYAERIKGKARQALSENGWLGWHPPDMPITFESLFSVAAPRSLQETVVALAPQLDQPALIIIEAPTGVGKTEAALYLADYWARALQQRGAYVAMPTMATSNQMYRRVREVLVRRYPSDLVNYHLLHGNALLMEDDEIVRLAKINEGGGQGMVAALSWFTKRKRGLLAPFAVGTVDQALMSILETDHFFVRLFGLSHKTVIFDEVHAYDTYMDELFYRLLRWLRVVGASVVVLSATLSETSRRALIEAYTGLTQVSLPEVQYPALTWTTGDQPHIVPLAAPDKRIVNLEGICREPEAIAEHLTKELAEGGCAAVICNTVERAQKVYQAIHAAKIVSEDDLIVFHARFPLAQRAEIEQEVVGRFGKRKAEENQSRSKAIVVATQVIEQSLDLDFDLIVSDLAPVDLIIQRAGRLHRHDGNVRPAGLRKPRLLIAMPDVRNEMPEFTHGDVYVYGRYFLLRSYLVLRDLGSITTPGDTRCLIESIYGPETCLPPLPSETFRKELDQARQAMEDDQRKAKREARGKLIPWPDDIELLEEPSACLEEDNPELHRYRQAATRLAPPSITLICLYETPRGLALDAEPNSPVLDMTRELDFPSTRTVYSHKIEVSDYRLVKHFAEQPTPPAWRENPWLRHARQVGLQEGGVYSPNEEKWRLRLDHKLGLVVEDQEAQ